MDSYYIEPVNTTLSVKSALVLGVLVTAKHTEKTASRVDSFTVHNTLKIGRREDELS